MCKTGCWICVSQGNVEVEKLAKITRKVILKTITTMNMSMPNSLNASFDKRVQTVLCGTSGEYIPELNHRDQNKRQLKEHLLIGMRSGVDGVIDADFFKALRQNVSHPVRVTLKD